VETEGGGEEEEGVFSVSVYFIITAEKIIY